MSHVNLRPWAGLLALNAAVAMANPNAADPKQSVDAWLDTVSRNLDSETAWEKFMDVQPVKRLVTVRPSAQPNRSSTVAPSTEPEHPTRVRLNERFRNIMTRPITLRELLDARSAVRDRIRVGSSRLSDLFRPGRRDIAFGDEPQRLMSKGEKLISNVLEMDQPFQGRSLLQGEVAIQPWSDDYWAIYKGVLGARYADEGFRKLSGEKWRPYYEYVNLKFPPTDILTGISGVGTPSSLDMMSPSEKYDLLVGDKHMSLTAYSWKQPQSMANADGKVETWMGICHGWAAAAHMMDRPERPVTLRTNVGNKTVTFYPADIKALASMLWAQVAPNARFVGGRCNEKDPRKKNGVLTDADCFDTNPGTWHQLVVSKIGVAKKSFVMDATFDYEVWNHPLHSYKITYFRPDTMKQVKSAQKGMIPLKDFKKDKFRDFRGQATHVVGVVMDVVYMVETEPVVAQLDTPSMDGAHQLRLTYDLELDAQGNILGGEWYQNAHPDFLWTYDQDDKFKALQMAETSFESSAGGEWRLGEETVPTTWASAAERASQRQGSPLFKVVDGLIRRATNQK